MHFPRVLVASVLAVSACSLGLDVPDGTLITCTSDAQCPSPYLCKSNVGHCVQPGADDVLPEALNVVTSAAYVGPSRPLTIEFDASRDLPQAPSVRLGSPRPAPFTMTSHDGLHFVFTRTPEAGDNEGSWPILVDMVDANGNAATGVALGTVVVDLEPPQPVSPALIYNGAPGNPLERITAAANGTTLEVIFSTSERIDGNPVVYADCGGTRVDFVRDSGDSTTFFTYSLTPTPALTAPDGDCPLFAELADLAGNPNSPLDLGATISLDRTAPDSATVFDMSRVRHLRVPHGAIQTAGAAGQMLARGDQDADSNPIGTAIDAAFIAAAQGETIVEVRAYPAADAGQLLGILAPQPDGSWPVTLLPNDAPELWLSAIDASGNASPRRRVPNSEWVVGLADKVPNSTFENPATLRVVTYTTPTFTQPTPSQREATSTEYAAAAKPDGTSASVEAEGLWTRRLTNSASPEGRYRATMAYDQTSGETFLFGGYYNDPTCYYLESAKLWGWNGYRWENTDVAEANRPLPRDGVQMAVDGRRGRLVLFGGAYQSTYGDTWEWDIAEKRWFERTPPEESPYDPVNSPQARSNGGMAYDSKRGLMVLFGGYYYGERNDLWLWNGDTGSWSEVQPTGTPPPPRGHTAITYDEERDVIVVFGGWAYTGTGDTCPADTVKDGVCYFGDTYEWSPVTNAWTKTRALGAGPSARQGFGFAYDPAGHRSYLFGGAGPANAHLNDVWAYDSTGWSAVNFTGTKPTGRNDLGMSLDPHRGKLVMHGGENLSFCNTTEQPETWEGDYALTWTNQTPGVQIVPSGRERHGMATGGPNGDVFMFGGFGDKDNLWRYNAATHHWTTLSALGAPVPPANAFGTSTRVKMTYDWTRNVVVVMNDIYSGATALGLWEFNVAAGTWSTPAQGGAVPYPRAEYALAFDASRNRVVLYGGQWQTASTCPDGSAPSGGLCMFKDVREWSGTTWTLRTYVGGPLPRASHMMEFDDDLDVLVVAGGNVPNGQNYDGSWVWNGATMTWNQLSGGAYGTDPSYRFRHATAFDMARDKLMMISGTSGDPQMEELDVLTPAWRTWTAAFGHPQPDQFKAAAYDRKTQQTIIFGGDLSLDELWTYQGGAATGPSLVLDVPVASSGIAAGILPDVLAVRVHAQGQGAVARTVTPGYDVALWNGSEWEVTGTTNPNDASRRDVLVSGAASIGKNLYGPLRSIQAMVKSTAPNGKGEAKAQISLDAIEVRVHVTYP